MINGTEIFVIPFRRCTYIHIKMKIVMKDKDNVKIITLYNEFVDEST